MRSWKLLLRINNVQLPRKPILHSGSPRHFNMGNDMVGIRTLRRVRGETTVHGTAQMYRCAGQTYWITEDMCNARQAVQAKCRRCTFRIGGLNSPRKEG